MPQFRPPPLIMYSGDRRHFRRRLSPFFSQYRYLQRLVVSGSIRPVWSLWSIRSVWPLRTIRTVHLRYSILLPIFTAIHLPVGVPIFTPVELPILAPIFPSVQLPVFPPILSLIHLMILATIIPPIVVHVTDIVPPTPATVVASVTRPAVG